MSGLKILNSIFTGNFMSFDTLGPWDFMEQSVADLQYDNPTDIQKLAIPEVLAGKDIVAEAQTGIGKTAAGLPIMQQINELPAKKEENQYSFINGCSNS